MLAFVEKYMRRGPWKNNRILNRNRNIKGKKSQLDCFPKSFSPRRNKGFFTRKNVLLAFLWLFSSACNLNTLPQIQDYHFMTETNPKADQNCTKEYQTLNEQVWIHLHCSTVYHSSRVNEYMGIWKTHICNSRVQTRFYEVRSVSQVLKWVMAHNDELNKCLMGIRGHNKSRTMLSPSC